jgi:hypothetical protein
MSATHETNWRINFAPAADGEITANGLAIWAEHDQIDWSTWGRARTDLERELTMERGRGWIPSTINIARLENGARVGYSLLYRPGIGSRVELEITPSELSQKIASLRRLGWRPCLIQSHPGPTANVSVVFRDDSDEMNWQYSGRLTQRQYETQLTERRADNWYPTHVASFVEGQVTHYHVIWQIMS